jgi:hypothetical protein
MPTALRAVIQKSRDPRPARPKSIKPQSLASEQAARSCGDQDSSR